MKSTKAPKTLKPRTKLSPATTRRRARSVGLNRSRWLFFMFVSVALTAFSLAPWEASRSLRQTTDTTVTKTFHHVFQPTRIASDLIHEIGTYGGVIAENYRLRNENRSLMESRDQIDYLQNKLTSYQKLFNLRVDTRLRGRGGRIIRVQNSPLSATKIAVNLGTDDLISVGDAVVDGNGLIGRIIETHDNFSYFMPLQALKSYIPVAVGDDAIQSLLVGDGHHNPKLEFQLSAKNAHPDQIVVTSDRTGLLPPGLPIGRVVAPSRQGVLTSVTPPLRVQLFSDFITLDYVRVLGMTELSIAADADRSDQPEANSPTALLHSNP